MTRRSDPIAGAIIADRYQVDRLIARGGMAVVYLAHHIKLNRPMALKVLAPPPDAEEPQAFEERFQLEAETLASLDHPNIVTLHDFGELDDERFFLAMEYVEGPRLSDLLREGPLPAEHALRLLIQVAAGLRYAHQHGVVHRDLKPSNLLIRTNLDGEQQVKVVDFGLVKLSEADQSITRAGLILGSPHCMAPEQVKGLDVDHRADIYALGVLLFRSITGQYPFHGPNSAATMIAHLNQPVPSFVDVAPDVEVPAGLEAIVRRCLQKLPDDRYTSMDGLIDDLAACMQVAPEPFRSVTQTHSTIQREVGPSSNRGWLVGIGALALAVVGALLVVLAIVLVWVMVPGADTEPEVAVPPPPTVQDVVPPEPEVAPPEPEPEPEPDVVTQPDPTPPVSTPTRPPPVVTAPPTPVVKPPTQDPPAEEPPAEEPPEEGETPEGYMGLPEDLFGD